MNDVLKFEYPLNATGLYSQETEPVFIAMEDLRPLGYRMADRQEGLDSKHCKLAIQGLARFHASSVAVVEKVIFAPKVRMESIF